MVNVLQPQRKQHIMPAGRTPGARLNMIASVDGATAAGGA
jgi:hypothetical protein